MQCEHSRGNGVILHTGAIGDCLLTLPLAVVLKNICSLHRLDFIGPSEYIDFYPGRTCIDTIKSVESIPLHRLFVPPREFETSDHDRLTGLFRHYEHVISFIGYDNTAFEANLLFSVHSTHSADVVVIPFKPSSNTNMHISDFYLHFYRQDHQVEQPFTVPLTTITPLPDDYLVGADILKKAGVNPGQPIVVIHPGSGSPDKCWYWENFVQTANVLKSRSILPVFLLGPAEQERFPKPALKAMELFNVLEDLSLTQVVQVLTQVGAFLGNDSGISHLAAGMGKHTLVLFGTSDPVHYAPRGENVAIEQIPADNFHRSVPDEQMAVINKLAEML
jgi:heptosyltransferase III